MPLSHNQIKRILLDYKFIEIRQKWSHKRFQTKDSPYKVTVNETKDYKPKTAKAILAQIAQCKNISVEEIIEIYNIKL